MNFVVLSTSRGTVLRATLERIADGSLKARCIGLITDRLDRGCAKIAEEFSIPVSVVERRAGEEREDYDRRLHTAILAFISPLHPKGGGAGGGGTLIACMGWMRLLSPWFVAEWKDKILNVHPSLLPKYPGAHSHEDVLAAGEHESGMTIHLIDAGMDSGKILIQKTCPVLPDDTVDMLKARVQALECEWFPKVLQQIEQSELKI